MKHPISDTIKRLFYNHSAKNVRQLSNSRRKIHNCYNKVMVMIYENHDRHWEHEYVYSLALLR